MMRKRKKKVSDKDLFIGRENCKTMIPNDLITEILSRLPAKSVARFSCVSKRWVSILHLPHFTELFLTVSLARPRLLFAFQYNGKWFFSSAPQSLNPDQNSSPLVVDYHKRFPSYFSFGMCAPVCGLTCTNSAKPMICNPSTGQYIPLPKAETVRSDVTTFFGYDPINKVFKVLSVYKGCRHQVLTLVRGELSWRRIQCSIPQIPLDDKNGICINGVLYYLAHSGDDLRFHEPFMVVCFDVRLEKFKFLAMDKAIYRLTLINCKGRLGVLEKDFPYLGNTIIELLVLDDADEQKWSKHTYVLPPLWEDITKKAWLSVVGMTCTGEIVLSTMSTQPDPFSIFYYNVERNTVVRVKIELGIMPCMRQEIYIFVDHIENVKPMQMLRT